MKAMARRVVSLMLAATLAVGWGAAAFSAEPLTADHKKQFERLIRDYLLENPEIVAKAIEALQEKRRVAEEQAVTAALDANRQSLLRDPTSPVSGDARGDVTLVEFFDYRCGVCKRVHPIVAQLMKDDRNLRRVYKEWPILGPDSIYASRAALASRKQGKYLAFHNALMGSKAKLDKRRVLAIARRVGLDTARLARDLESADISAILQRNFRLADKLKLNGTPSFVIGDVLLRGARDLETMKRLVAAARAK